jgi:hypothetical protein
MPVCADGFWFPSWPGAPSEAGVEASAAVTSDAETAPEQAPQQVRSSLSLARALPPTAPHRIYGPAPGRSARPMQRRAPIAPTYAGPVSMSRKQRKQSRRLPS